VITSHLYAWVNVALALAGPAFVAAMGALLEPHPPALGAHAIGLLAIVMIAFAVYAWAILGEGYTLERLGFRHVSWVTPLLAIALTVFFVLVVGPIAYWILARAGSQGFGAGIEAVNQLPTGYLMLAIAIVASAEELLYRGYAIERLSDLTGSYVLASMVSVVAFGLAHVPMWGWAPAATTIVSGGILTAAYLWRRDILAVILAHTATDLHGIVLAPYLTRSTPY
jgi:uncharacterized protein